MAREPFLINPHRLSRTRRRKAGVVRRTRGRLPGRLLSRMMRTYGPGRGMKEAWGAFRRGVRRNIPSLGFLNPRRHRRYRRKRLNPFGEEVMIVGANPRRRRRRVSSRRRRRARAIVLNPRRRRRSVRRRRARLFANPRRRSYRRKRRATFFDNPRRRRYRRRRAMFFDNPRRSRRSYRRRFRRNPRRAVAAGIPALSFRRPMSLLMPAAVATAGFFAAEKVPSMVNVTSTLPRLGVKAAVGFGGGMLVSKFLGRSNGAIFAIGVSINLLTDILNTYVFKTNSLVGLSAFPYASRQYAGIEAYPQEFGAFPTDQGYPM